MSRKITKMEDRFFDQVIPEPMSGCLLWIGPINELGYGTFGVYSEKTKKWATKKAHRVAWSIYNKKEAPNGMCVLHKCDLPRCVAEGHLFIGTHKDNSRDMVRKKRNKTPFKIKTECVRGHKYEGQKMYTPPNGFRACRICLNENQRNYTARNKLK